MMNSIEPKKKQKIEKDDGTYFDRQFDEWMENDCKGDIEDYGQDQ